MIAVSGAAINGELKIWCDFQARVALYFTDNSLTGRTSMLPTRAGGILDAIWMASLRSPASIM